AAGLGGLADLGERMRRQGAQVGMDRADVWVALTDGGSGLEEFIGVYFPRCECILDFYHAAEHLGALAQALHPADDGRAREAAGAVQEGEGPVGRLLGHGRLKTTTAKDADPSPRLAFAHRRRGAGPAPPVSER